MKLSGPLGAGIRFLVGRPTRAVVSGIFPPEVASAFRVAVEASLAKHQPAIAAALDAELRAVEHELIHGNPSFAGEPRGVMNASGVEAYRI